MNTQTDLDAEAAELLAVIESAVIARMESVTQAFLEEIETIEASI